MKLDHRCFDCLLSRVALECSLCNASPELTRETVGSCRELLQDLRNRPLLHPEIASAVHRRAYEALGSKDPFARLKEESNQEALGVCRAVRPGLSTFKDYVLASIIGNTFDYGVSSHNVTGNFMEFFKTEFAAGLTIDDTPQILKKISRVVYFTDNCGEIVFDCLLLEFLKKSGAYITLAVRDAPILNDATMTEVRQFHLDRYVDAVTTTGCGCELGVRLDCMPPLLSGAMEDCTLVIAKGMANYESLSEYSGLPPVAFLMSVKCEPIAEEVGVPRGSKIALLRE